MKYDYRVIFQRDGWRQPQHRITRLDIYRRPVGDWEDHHA